MKGAALCNTVTLPFDVWTIIFRIYLKSTTYKPSRIGKLRLLNQQTRQWLDTNRCMWANWTCTFFPSKEYIQLRSIQLSDDHMRVLHMVANCMAGVRPSLILINTVYRFGRTTLMQIWTDFILYKSQLKVAILCATWQQTQQVTCGIISEPSTYKRMIEARAVCKMWYGDRHKATYTVDDLDTKEDLKNADILLVDNYHCIDQKSLAGLCHRMLSKQKRCILIGNKEGHVHQYWDCLKPVVINAGHSLEETKKKRRIEFI